MPPQRIDGYLPIGSYGLIGDCRSAALVGADGSIDWLCLPQFNDGSLFGHILDDAKGGYWRIAPETFHSARQRYHDRTNILLTTFSTGSGVVAITDFMPIIGEPVTSMEAAGEPRLVRIVECLSGEATVVQDIVPAPDYARDPATFVEEGGLLHADVQGNHLCFASTTGALGRHGSYALKAGETIVFALSWGPAGTCQLPPLTGDQARYLFRATQDYWWRWSRKCRYNGPFQEPVQRSALALKLMTHAPTGAIVAAPTTSLPELIGGARNWDYRFTWIRDASFTLYAFFQLGLTEEAHQFFRWLVNIGFGKKAPDIPNLFSLTGDSDIQEIELDHLEGYRGSRPVRIGNGAVNQVQLDIYGELLDSAYLYSTFGGMIGEPLWRELRMIVDLAVARWQEPDVSIWEMRGPKRHFTYSTVMCWVAVDRGLRIAEKLKLPHDSATWRAARSAMHRRVQTQGYSAERGAFTQTLGGTALDASLLRMSQVRFLRGDHPRLASTIEAIKAELGAGILVYRYKPEENVDGMNSDEGTFLMCSFWLVDALAHVGRVAEAQQLFERLLGYASPLLLFAEEADARTGDLLGNYPQAFTHLSVIGAAVNIERARRRQLGGQTSRLQVSGQVSGAAASATR